MPRQTIVRRYIAHPAAGAGSSYVADGKPLDAGTAMGITSNLNHLCDESYRHLFHSVFIGDITDPGNDWDETDGDKPDADDQINEKAIAWSRLTARVYGPFACLHDRPDSDSSTSLARNVKISVRAYGDGAEAHKIYVAATQSEQPPSEGSLAFATIAGSTTMSGSVVRYTKVLSWSRITVTQNHHALDPETPGGTGQVRQPEYWIWIGWKVADSGTFGIIDASAYETNLAP